MSIDGVHLRLAALIAPDQRGANDVAGAVQHHQSVHLPGKSDASDLRAVHAAIGEHATDGQHGGVPPILGALFGPQRALLAHVLMRRGKPRANGALVVDEERARTTRTDIDSQPHRIYYGVTTKMSPLSRVANFDIDAFA